MQLQGNKFPNEKIEYTATNKCTYVCTLVYNLFAGTYHQVNVLEITQKPWGSDDEPIN